MIIATVRILPPQGRRSDVVEVLRSVQGRVQDLRGCASCSIYEEDAPESAVVFVERWTCERALDAHLRSDMFARVIGAMELSAAAPDIRFEHVTATEGIELVERSRGATRSTAASGGEA